MSENEQIEAVNTEDQKPKRKPRDTGQVIVEHLVFCEGFEGAPGAGRWDELAIPDIETTADAERWIRERGDDGETYRVARVKSPMTVSVEKVEVRNVRG